MAQHLENSRGQTMTLPPTLYVSGFNRPRPVTIVETLTGDALARHSVPRAARGALTGTLVGSNYEAAQALLDDLLSFITAAPLKLRLHGGSSRYLTVYPEGMSDEATVLARAATISIPLIAPDPHWTGTARSEHREVTTSVTFNVTNHGSANVHPVIKLIGRSAGGQVSRNPKVMNNTTGSVLEFGNLLSQGQTLTVNTVKRTALLGAEGKLDEVNDSFLIHGFHLQPGVNSLTVSTTAPSAAVRLEMDWSDRWL